MLASESTEIVVLVPHLLKIFAVVINSRYVDFTKYGEILASIHTYCKVLSDERCDGFIAVSG